MQWITCEEDPPGEDRFFTAGRWLNYHSEWIYGEAEWAKDRGWHIDNLGFTKDTSNNHAQWLLQ